MIDARLERRERREVLREKWKAARRKIQRKERTRLRKEREKANKTCFPIIADETGNALHRAPDSRHHRRRDDPLTGETLRPSDPLGKHAYWKSAQARNHYQSWRRRVVDSRSLALHGEGVILTVGDQFGMGPVLRVLSSGRMLRRPAI